MAQTATAKKGNSNGTAPAAKSPAPDTIKEKAKQDKRDARKAAVKKILDFMKANPSLSIMAELKLFVKEPGSRGRKASPVFASILNLLKVNGAKGVSEMDIFKNFRIGRPEMAHNIRKALLTEKPADRVWIALDESSETYFIKGTGAKAPEKWDGYIPAEKTDL